MIGLNVQSCRHLLFTSRISLDDSILEEIQVSFDVNLSAKRRWRILERVALDRSVEYVQVQFEKQPGNESNCEVGFHYDAEMRTRRARTTQAEYPKATEILSILSSLSQPAEFDCEALFAHPPPSAQNLFPMRTQELERNGGAFDEIRGITLVKLEQDEVLYNVTLQSLDLQELLLDVSFNHVSTFSDSLPREVLRKASNIQSNFLA